MLTGIDRKEYEAKVALFVAGKFSQLTTLEIEEIKEDIEDAHRAESQFGKVEIRWKSKFLK